MAPRDHRRVHADGDGVVAVLVGRSSQIASSLTTEPIVPGGLDVGRGHLGDALAVHVGGGHPGVEGQRGQDRGLGGGVEPLDVGGRVGLGVAELLGLLERLGEAGARAVHLVEDEVGGAVDDAEHPGHPVAGQRLAQRPQDRDGAGHGGLVVEVAAGLLGRLEEGRPVLGEQRLVGGDHARAVLERGEDQACGPARCRRSPRRRGRRRRGPPGPAASVVSSPSGTSTSRGASSRRTATPTSSIGAPTRAARSPACSWSSRTTWEPTEPQPSTATLSVRCVTADPKSVASRSSIVSRRTTTRDVAVADRDHRRPERVVVVGGHRAAVGAGAGHRDQVAGARRRRAGTRP